MEHNSTAANHESELAPSTVGGTARPAPEPDLLPPLFERGREVWDLAFAKALAWRLRSDVRAGRSALESPAESFEQWWLVQGRSEYPYWSYLSSEQKKALWEKAGELPVGPIKLAIPKIMQVVLARRPDVLQKFSQEQKVNVEAVAAWFWMLGVHEHLLLSAVTGHWLRELDRPVPLDPKADPKPVMDTPLPTILMHLAWTLLGPALQEQMALTRSETRERYLAWFFGVGVHVFRCQALIANRWRSWLLQELPANPKQPELGQLPRFALMEYALSDARARSDLTNRDQVGQLRAWAQAAFTPTPKAVASATTASAQGSQSPHPQGAKLATKWAWLQQKSISSEEASIPEYWGIWQPPAPSDTTVQSALAAPPLSGRPLGVNLFGFAFGELGIGEDLRMAVAVCQAAGIPYRIINIAPGREAGQGDRSVADEVSEGALQLSYPINLFCMPVFDIVGRIFLRYGERPFRNHYNIGWAPWELAVWPRAWQSAFELLDELWACSQFSEQMYLAHAKKSVTAMPLATSIARLKRYSRKYFGLPNNTFLFLYVFDCNSGIARKNPHAAINAFLQAFPRKSDVGLVLKVMNPKVDDPQWVALERLAKKDRRIVLLTQTLERSEVLGLINVCDAYVSPHRAEGFGRTLTEAMLMGKPVVATNYSGNQFFMEPSLTFPVNYTLIPVVSGQYHFVEDGDGALWANPDLSHLADQLKAAHAFSKHANSARKIRAYAQAVFAPERTAHLMQQRLNQIIRQWRQIESSGLTSSKS